VGRAVTDARSQLSSSKVEAVELLKWGLDKGLILLRPTCQSEQNCHMIVLTR